MKQELKVYFISGVCGVGKTSSIKHLKNLLSGADYDIRDFDERGVPDGGGFKWHTEETLNWLKIAKENAISGRSTIITGFQNPEEFKKIYSPLDCIPATIILLNASSDTIRRRLLGRYPTEESILEINRASGVPLDKFVEDIISFAPILRDIFQKENCPIIETDNKTSEEVAREILRLLK
jgi:broad-specificity NMP kinase